MDIMFKIKIILFITILFSLYSNGTKISADDKIIPKSLDQYIQQIFGSKAKVAKAVLKHESNLQLNSINYNCIYNGHSTFCKRQDRINAHSVDCGIGQINQKGKVCPKALLTLEGNMKAVEKVYKEQGLNAWVSYKNKAYLKYL